MSDEEKTSVELSVDGKKMPLNPFVSGLIANAVTGMIASLKGGEGAKEIELKITQE